MRAGRSASVVRLAHRTAHDGVLGARSGNIVWSPALVTRQERAAAGQIGTTLWVTGLPASGKSTLGAQLERRLVLTRRLAYRLDGDHLRQGLNEDLGFDPQSRRDNVRRIAHVADTPLGMCERRDPKGLYARARRGEIEAFTGISDSYEAVEHPDVHLRDTTAEEAVAILLAVALEPAGMAA